MTTTLLAPTQPTTTSAPPLALRPVFDLATGDQVGGWSETPGARLDDLTAHTHDWPTWRWLGLDAHLLPGGDIPSQGPGRPVVVSLPLDATVEEAASVRSWGSWSNVAVRGLGPDLRAATEAVARLRPAVALIEGRHLHGLPRSTSTLVLAGLVAMLQELEALPVLVATGHASRLLDAARDAGLRVVL